jgi:plastocyanin
MSLRATRLAPACLALTLVLAACAGGAASPSASTAPASPAPSAVEPSAPASAEPSASASTEPSMAPSGSAEPSGSAAPSGEADITVTAVDFAFQGIPADVPSGTTMALTNAGQELHELVVVRKLPTTTETFPELLAMNPEEAQSLVEDVGFAIAEPGQTATDVVTIGEPGEYLAVCFIPAGTTSMPSIDPNSSEPPDLGTGAPHFTLGMLQEFTVTE